MSDSFLLLFFRSVLDFPHVIWIDNYAHVLRVNCPTAASGWWRQAQWTAKAAVTLESLKESQLFLKSPQSEGMPTLTELFDPEVTDRFVKYFKIQEDKKPLFFDTSVSKNVRTIPIKPDVPLANRAHIDRKFIPLGILAPNIGSNQGLLKVLMDHRIEEEKKPHIPALLVDCNIYWRIMKVLFLFLFPSLCALLCYPFPSFIFVFVLCLLSFFSPLLAHVA